MAKDKMAVKEALAIIRELAEQNALDPEECDPELEDEAQRQEEAFEVFDNFVENVLN